jgi:hypothetical protein
VTETGSTYDFKVQITSATSTEHASAGTANTIKLSLFHRSTFTEYAAVVASGLSAGSSTTVKYSFPDSTDILDIKGVSLYIDSGSDGWLCANMEIMDGSDAVIYTMAPDHVGSQSMWVDHSKSVLGHDMHYELNQILPLPVLHTEETKVRVTLIISSANNADGPASGLRFRFKHRNLDYVASRDEFSFASYSPSTLAKSGTYDFDMTLAARIGDIRTFEIENENNNGIKFTDVTVSVLHGSTYVLLNERDINGDGIDWAEWVDGNGAQKKISWEIMGGNFQHEWSATVDSTDVKIAVAGSGPSVGSRSDGANAMFQFYARTIESANIGASSSDRNYVDMALYKCDDSVQDFCTDIHNLLDDAADLTDVVVSLIHDDRVSLTPATAPTFRSDTGIFSLRTAEGSCGDGGDCMMHNKFVCVKQTDDGETVLVSTANLHNSGHARWQQAIRISGIEDLWQTYHQYFYNLYKYKGDTLADILPDGQSAAPFWQGTPTETDGTFREATACSAGVGGHCASSPYFHEWGSSYDKAETTLGDLQYQVWFAPRPTGDAPWADIFSDCKTWLDADLDRRAEVFVLSLSQTDNDTTDKLRDLYADPQAQVYSLFAMMNEPGIDNQDYTRSNPHTEGFNARFDGPAGLHRVHAKSVFVKKWTLDGSTVTLPVFDYYVGSMNMNYAARETRDNNLLRITWKGSASAIETREFEQWVFRPLVDQFTRAYNDGATTDWIGTRV